MVADAYGQVEAALELLEQVRAARRGLIEALREEISRSGDIEAAKECCRLLEEEIGAARASKDAEGERIAAASLEVVRRLAEPEEEIEEGDDALEYARTLVTNKDIGQKDEKWAAMTIRGYLADFADAEDPVFSALRATLSEYRKTERNAPKTGVLKVDTRSYLVE